jgi:hypothetical protein
VLKTLQALNSFLGTILALAVVGLISFGGWIGFRSHFADKFALMETEEKLAQSGVEIARLSRDLDDKTNQVEELDIQLTASRAEARQLARDIQEKIKEIQRLETAMTLLKVDHRLARIEVLSQQGSSEKDDLATQFSFVELDKNGNPLEAARQFSIKGDVLYLDGWVVKFTDEYVEQGDLLRSTSICLFRRLFGENQQPSEGFALDPVGSLPAAYRTGGEPSEFEQRLWSRFWDLANDPQMARKEGVRAAHGEAPSIKLKPGMRYQVKLRASDGLSIVPEEIPPGDQTTSAL